MLLVDDWTSPMRASTFRSNYDAADALIGPKQIYLANDLI